MLPTTGVSDIVAGLAGCHSYLSRSASPCSSPRSVGALHDQMGAVVHSTGEGLGSAPAVNE